MISKACMEYFRNFDHMSTDKLRTYVQELRNHVATFQRTDAPEPRRALENLERAEAVLRERLLQGIVASVARRSLIARESLAVGDTREFPDRMLRFVRTNNAIRVTDLRNAGRRGKRVPTFGLYDLDYIEPKYADHFAQRLVNTYSYEGALNEARTLLDVYTEEVYMKEGLGRGKPKLYETEERAIDVAPVDGGPLRIETQNVEITLEHDDFSIRDKRDTANRPTTISPARGARTAVKRLREWVQQNREKIQHMTFHEVLESLRRARIGYHDYSAVD